MSLSLLFAQKTPHFEVFEVENINSKRSDFSPVVVDDKLIFVSEQESDLLNIGEVNFSWIPYTSLVYSKISDKNGAPNYSKPRLYKPAQFSSSSFVGSTSFFGDNAIYSYVDLDYLDSHKVAHPGIVFEKHNFPYNSNLFSTAQPSMDKSNMILYFASDRPGGFGGSDIYKSEFNKGKWQEPINLGKTVNTSANESFPFIHADGTLYFSSDREAGYGGLDVYFSKNVNGDWITNHIDRSLNTLFDDFGIFLYPDGKSGFFSSNREGGKGKDDIYSITLEWKEITKPMVDDKTTMQGVFSYKKLGLDPPNGMKVYLVNDDDEIIHMSTTDNRGYFQFQNLSPYDNYYVKVDEKDADLVLNILGDNSSETIAVLSNDKAGMFLYRELGFEQIGGLGLLYTTDADMKTGDLTKSFTGQFRFRYLENDSLGGLVVQMVDDDGNVVFTTTTDSQGMFSFKNLPFDQTYVIRLSESNPDIELLAINDDGVVAELGQNKEGEFVFVKMAQSRGNSLNAIMEEDVSMFTDTNSVMAQFGYKYIKNLFIKKATVTVVDKMGKLITSAITDNDGKIYINKLASRDSLSFSLTGHKLDTHRLEMRLYDHRAEEIAVVSPKNGVFKYRFLQSESFLDPMVMNEEDMALELSGKHTIDKGEVMVRKVTDDILVIYFSVNSAEYNFMSNEELNNLLKELKENPLLQVDITAYSDRTGTPEYNKTLSVKRAQGVVNYLTANGIAKNRIAFRGLGATNFAVDCLTCTDQQNQLNRRAVLRVK